LNATLLSVNKERPLLEQAKSITHQYIDARKLRHLGESARERFLET
jgi:hypothetical protein